MSKAVSAYGATLSVHLNGQWRRFSEVSSIAELGDTAKTIDATRFGDSRLSYIKDCSDQSLMQFNMYAVPTSEEDSNLAIIKQMDEDAAYDFQVHYPTLNETFNIRAQWVWALSEGAVSGPMEIYLTLIPVPIARTATSLIAVSSGGGYTDLPMPAKDGYTTMKNEEVVSGRNTSRVLYKDRIRFINTVEVKWNALTPEEKTLITRLTDDNAFALRYFDVTDSTIKYGRFYRGSDFKITPLIRHNGTDFVAYNVEVSFVEF